MVGRAGPSCPALVFCNARIVWQTLVSLAPLLVRGSHRNPPSRSMRHAASGVLAGAHAAPAGFGADPAMRVHLGMLLALLRAQPAGRGTGVEHAADHLLVRAGASRSEASSDVADIGTIKIEPNALCQLGDVVLAEAGIS